MRRGVGAGQDYIADNNPVFRLWLPSRLDRRCSAGLGYFRLFSLHELVLACGVCRTEPKVVEMNRECLHDAERRYWLGDLGPLCAYCVEHEVNEFHRKANLFYIENGYSWIKKTEKRTRHLLDQGAYFRRKKE